LRSDLGLQIRPADELCAAIECYGSTGNEGEAFDGLRNFKDKFDPEWEPRFLVAPARSNILLIATDAAALIAGGMRKVVVAS